MLAHVLGLDDPSGRWYLFWSGVFGAIDKVSLIGAGYVVFRRHNCQSPKCWRVGRHHVVSDGVGAVYCRHHVT